MCASVSRAYWCVRCSKHLKCLRSGLENMKKGGEESCFDGEEVSDGVRGRSGKDSVEGSKGTDRGRCE